MRGVVIGYIVVQLVFAIIAVFSIVIAVQGQKKPSCKGECEFDVEYVEGTSCKDLKPLGVDPRGNSIEAQCSSTCPSHVKWVSACTGRPYTLGGPPPSLPTSSCVKCVSLQGKPSTYYIVAGVLLVLPAIVFLPIIYRKPKHR
jgi:hypothetical protein